MPTITEEDGIRTIVYPSGTVVRESCTAPVSPPPQRRITKKQFRDRLHPNELIAIYSQDFNVSIKIWLAYFNDLAPDADGTSVDLDDPQTRKGLEDIAPLVPYFTTARISEILGAE